jgi:hypothetical protein
MHWAEAGGQLSFAGGRSNGKVAPIPDLYALPRNGEVRSLSGHSAQHISACNLALLEIDIDLDRLVE